MKRKFFPLAIPLLLIIVAVIQGQRPYYNWDMFPYMALTVKNDSKPFSEVHAFVYKEAARVMPPQDFEAIAQRQPTLRADANAFQRILKYYDIKPWYILLTRTLHGLGLGLLTATYVPSLLAYFLLGCLFFSWMMKVFRIEYAALITLLLAASPFLLDTARYSSPDMLCALLLVGGVFLITEFSVMAGLSLCVVSILVRPDAVVFVITLAMALYFAKELKLVGFLVTLAVTLALTLVVMGGPSFIVEYLFTTADYDPSWEFDLMIQHYLSGLRAGLHSVAKGLTPLFTLAGTFTLYLRMKSGISIRKDLWSLLIVGSLLTILLRYFLHPLIEDRFQIASYVVIIFGFCKIIPVWVSLKSSSV